MNWQGSINFLKPIKINGKPHGIEHESTLPTWTSDYSGCVIHAEDTGKLWFGTSTEWTELTNSSSDEGLYDDRYYTETEIDAFFYGENSGKKQIDYAYVVNTPSEFVPISHDNTYHSEVYITVSGVTFETLQTNGDIGLGSDQLAIGSHNHDTEYAPLSHTHDDRYYTETEVDTLLSEYYTSTLLDAGQLDSRYYTETEIVTLLSGYSLTSHIHASSEITYDNTLSGLTATDVKSAIDELDTNIEALNLNAATFEALSAAGDIGTGSDQVAVGNHTHVESDITDLDKYTQTEVDTLLSGYYTSTLLDAGQLDSRYYTETEVNTLLDEIIIPSTSGAPVDTPAERTVRFDISTNILYIYNGTSWVSTTLS